MNASSWPARPAIGATLATPSGCGTARRNRHMAEFADQPVGLAQLIAEANGTERINASAKIAEMVIYATITLRLQAAIATYPARRLGLERSYTNAAALRRQQQLMVRHWTTSGVARSSPHRRLLTCVTTRWARSSRSTWPPRTVSRGSTGCALPCDPRLHRRRYGGRQLVTMISRRWALRPAAVAEALRHGQGQTARVRTRGTGPTVTSVTTTGIAPQGSEFAVFLRERSASLVGEFTQSHGHDCAVLKSFGATASRPSKNCARVTRRSSHGSGPCRCVVHRRNRLAQWAGGPRGSALDRRTRPGALYTGADESGFPIP